ncbi:peptide ABC transporter substrate-binding protein [Lacticaseibacillus jixiensis]|uniref:peptide ABC transporter substrate-binding protein n=1 Tax=Lacticaseibacillus jixiensis TaxID=3231926 RepID=UPI0036F3955E
MKKNAVVGIMVAISAIVLTACGQKKQAASTTSWNRMEANSIITLDPSLMTDATSAQALVDSMDGLYRYAGKDLVPAVAKKIAEPTDNGLVYTFELKHTKWSNGDPVTAQDFVYAWRRTIDPATKSQYAYLYSGIKNADAIMAGKKAAKTLGIQALGNYKLQVTLERAMPYFKTMMVAAPFFPQDSKAVNKYGKHYGTKAQDVLTNGAYTVKQWDGNSDSWYEVKNPRYWNAKNVHIKRINVQVVKEPSTALNLYNDNKLDQATVTGASALQAKKMSAYTPLKRTATYYVALNIKRSKVLRNLKVRQAMGIAFDRKQFIKKVLNDGSVPATGIVPEGLAKDPKTGADFEKESSAGMTQYTAYDPAKAKQLWKEGLKEVGVKSVKLEMLTNDIEAAKHNAEYFKGIFEQNLPGLTIDIKTMPQQSAIQAAKDGDFDLNMTAWGADFPDPINFLNLFTTGASGNDGGYSNKTYDALIKATGTTYATNETKRWDTMVQAQKLLTKDVGVIPIYQQVQSTVQRKTMHNLKYGPTSTYDFVNAYLK